MFDSHDWHEPSSDTCGLNALRVHGGGHIVDALMTRVEFRYLCQGLEVFKAFSRSKRARQLVYGQVSSSFIPRRFSPDFSYYCEFSHKNA